MLSYSLRTNAAPRLDSEIPFDRRVSVVILAVEHLDVLATGRPHDSDGLYRTEQSGSQPRPVCGNGLHGGNALQFLLTPMCMIGNDKCDAS
jgi:hypothetical protein